MKNEKKNFINDKSNILSDNLKIIINIYGMSKALKNKLIMIANPVKGCLINYEWIKKFKEYCNYNKISKELDNLTKDYNYNDFENFNKVKSLIENIKKKNIFNINEKIDLQGISIYPQKNILFDNINYYSNFFVINEKLFFTIKNTDESIFKNDNKQGLIENYLFYINSKDLKGFYKRDNFIEIGKFNLYGEFISEYLLKFNSINIMFNDEIKEYINNGFNKFFNKMKIEKNNPEKQPLIINNKEIGEIIILKYCSPIKNITPNNIDNKIENKKEKNNNEKHIEIKTNSIKQNEIKSNDNNERNKNARRNEIKINNNITERNKNARRNEIKSNNNITEINKNGKQNKNNNLNVNNKNIRKNEKKNNDNNIERNKNDKQNEIKKFFQNCENERKEENKFNNNIKCFKDISMTPMIGLENIGQTCYMNAALQCFSNSYALVNYFLDSNKISLIENAVKMKSQEEPQLTSEFQELISNLWIKKSKNYYSPHNFKTTVGKIEPLFKNFEANVAKDFVNFIIMTLHKELNGIDNSFTNTNYIESPSQNINQYNNAQVLQAYLYYFQLDNSSIISTYFYGTTQGEIECQNCKMQLFQMGQNIPTIKYNYQTYFFLNFPLDEVRKFIMSNQILYQNYMTNGIDPNKEVNLNECFLYNQKDDYMFGYCERCDNNNAQLLSRTKLFTIPLYLIILLNRGRGIEFNIKINFPETFNSNGMAINSNGNYILYGVVKHFGDNSSSGHFAAYCISPVDNLWYFYNDANVTPVSEQEKAVIQNNGLTYILFYRKI